MTRFTPDRLPVLQYKTMLDNYDEPEDEPALEAEQRHALWKPLFVVYGLAVAALYCQLRWHIF